MSLSQEQRDQFERDGYLEIDPGIPDAVIDAANRELDARWDRTPSRPGLLNAHRLRDAWRLSPATRKVACAPAVRQALSELYGREAYPFQTLNFLVGTQQPAHADTIHFNSLPAGFICGAWVALEDIGPESGPLSYYPGSHRLPEQTMESIGIPSEKESYEKYEEFMRRSLVERGLEPRLALLRKGQAFLWHGNLVHGGSERHDLLSTRRSQATHFSFADCRQYTPMRSRGARLFVTNPRRIHAEGTPIGERLRWAAGFCSPWFIRHFATQNVIHIARHLLG